MKQLMTGSFAALLAVGLTTGQAWATDYAWTGGGDGVTWTDTANWKDGLKFVSSTSNRLIFENPTENAVIAIPGDLYVNSIKFAAGCKSMTLTGTAGRKITNTYKSEALTDATTETGASIFVETTEPVKIDVIQVMTGGRSVGLAQGAHLEIVKPIVDNADKKGRVYFRTLGASRNSYLKIDYDPTAAAYALDPKEGGFLFKFVGGTNELSAALTATAQTDPKPIVCESVGALKLNAGTYPREITFDSSSSDAMLQTVGAVTFGTNLVVGAKTFTLDFGGVTTLSGALKYTYSGVGNAQTLKFGADASLAGNVTVTGQGGAYTLDLAEGVCVDFLGDVTLTGANLNQPLPVGSRVNYRGSVTCSAFQDGSTEPGAGHRGGEIHLYTPLSCGTFFLRGYNVVCEAANVLPSDKDIRWRYESQANCAIVDMNGFDQKVTHLNCIGAFTSVNRNYITSAKPCTLTINDTFTEADPIKAQVGVDGAVSVVHIGNQVQEFNSRDINTTGELTINSGKIKLSGSTVIKNVPKITIGADGELVLAGTAAKPIPDGTVLCFSSAGGGIDATDYQGTSLTLSNRVYVDGELVPYGTYTEENASWLKGGKITVAATAVIWREAVSGSWTDETKWTKLPEAGEKVFIDADGEDYVVSITADNAAMGALTVGNKSGRATLSVGAALSWPAWSTVAIDQGGRILVGDGGALDYCSYDHNGDTFMLSTGGALELDGAAEVRLATQTGACAPIKQQGGDIVAGDTSKLTLEGAQNVYLGSGKTTLKDSAILETVTGKDKDGKALSTLRFYTQTTVAGITNHLVVTDQACFRPKNESNANLDQVIFGYPNSATDGLFRFDYGSAARSFFGNQIELGATWGYAEMNVTAGLVAVGAYGLGVGGFHYDGRSVADANVVGVLNVVGGAIDIYASAFSGTKNRVRGLLLGEGWYDKKTATSRNLFTGYVNLSDGAISNRYGAVIIGAGAAKGVWTQTGGAFVNDAAQTKGPMILGWLGGEGTYILSNGTVNVSSANVATYVGGAETNLTPWVLEAQAPSSTDAARGLLSLQGGTFTTAGDVVVGQDGDGTIEVGANGRLSARSLELKVAAATAEKPAHSSTLKFTAGGLITLSGSLKSVADAQLEFDLTDWDKSTRLRFVSCNGLEGSAVDWDNVSFRGVAKPDFSNAGGLKYVFRQTAHGIAVGKASGCAIIVR